MGRKWEIRNWLHKNIHIFIAGVASSVLVLALCLNLVIFRNSCTNAATSLRAWRAEEQQAMPIPSADDIRDLQTSKWEGRGEQQAARASKRDIVAFVRQRDASVSLQGLVQQQNTTGGHGERRARVKPGFIVLPAAVPSTPASPGVCGHLLDSCVDNPSDPAHITASGHVDGP